MSMGDGEGLGDPGMKGTLLKLAHPSRDTCDTSRERAGLHRLHHIQGIKDHPDRSLQKIVLVALSLKGPSYMGKLLFQLDRDVSGAQPSAHRVTEIRSEGADHLDVLVHLLLKGHGPTLGLPSEVPLHLQLLQDLAGLLISRGIPLQQLVSLLSEPGDSCSSSFDLADKSSNIPWASSVSSCT